MLLTRTLPPGYRLPDVLAFHRRDRESIAERVGPTSLAKGLLLEGVPVVLALQFEAGLASCTVLADGALPDDAPARLGLALDGMLGLRIDPQPFTTLYTNDTLLGTLVRAQPGLRIVQSATVFEALTWAIIGQQINLPFAIALRRSFIQQAGRQHSSGLWCYPDAADAARLDADSLTSRKFSRAKADTVLRLAQLVDNGALDLDLHGPRYSGDVGALSAALLAVKGIGPWTVNYALLRGYAHADCSLHGDVAIRAALQRLLGEAAKPDLRRTETLLAAYHPHRTMAAAHLWASLMPAVTE